MILIRFPRLIVILLSLLGLEVGLATFIFFSAPEKRNIIIFICGQILILIIILFILNSVLKEYEQIIKKTQKMGQKFSQWVNVPDEPEPPLTGWWFKDLRQALDQVKEKLLLSRKRLAHEFEQGKALMSSLTEAILAVDTDGRPLYYNGPFAVSFIPPVLAQKFAQKETPIWEVIKDRALNHALRDKVLRAHETVSAEFRLRNELLGLDCDYAVKISPLFEEKRGEEIYGALLVFHDITDIKTSHAEKLQFVENASHELRTPLTSLKGYLDIAINDLEPTHPARPLLLRAAEGAQRLVALVNDLLDLAAMDKNPSLHKSYFSPRKLMERVKHILSPLAQEKQIEIILQGDPQLEVYLDEVKMEQILINLISNAIRYNPPKTKVSVSWKATLEGSEWYVIDDGVGIPREHWEKIFDRFYRIDKGRSREQGGTGLGLAIVKQLVELQGGEIRIVPPPGGKGSAFFIRFVTLQSG